MKTPSLLALLFATSLATAAEKTTSDVWSYTGRDLFPSMIIATATVDWNGDEQMAEDKKTADDPKLKKDEVAIYGDENGIIAAELDQVPAGAQVSVEIAGEGFLKPSKWSGVIKKGHDFCRVFPKAVWDYAALHQVTQQRPATVTVKVTVNGEALPEVNETVVLRSIKDCPYYILIDEDGEDIDDLSWMFAAYVNENHPWIDGLLKEALDAGRESGLIQSFDGYQSGDPEVVLAQVFAIWNALQRRDIKYSSITTTTPSKFAVCQTVRFLDDSVQNAQANCVDGSVLMASILRKIGIDVYLVMVPGHCFLAFATSEDDDADIYGLETTMLGQDNLKPVKDLPKLPAKIKQKEFKASRGTFESALDTGNESLEEHWDEFESGEDPNIQLISIEDAREMGIMPLASGKKKE
ncbi:MAG: hypothetical protein JNG86_22660 [Verrucomicrobiaceae bacterium]|nr:hypothetical protein [Verrucomicrobiaceae bacterium]